MENWEFRVIEMWVIFKLKAMTDELVHFVSMKKRGFFVQDFLRNIQLVFTF